MPTLQFSEGSRAPPIPLLNRKQLLNNIVDGMASVRPKCVWATVPRDKQSYKAGVRKITYKEMANAINGLAQWLVNNIGSSTSFETLSYVGPWDPRYVLVLLGAVKAGYKTVFPSPGFSAAGLSQLMHRLDCTKLLASSKQLPIVTNLSHHMALDVYEIPPLNELLDIEYPHFPYNKTFESAKSQPLTVIHTSGATGTPKLLILTHDWAASWIQQNQRPAPEGFNSLECNLHGVELCAVIPPNHSTNFYLNLFGAIANQIVVMYPALRSALTIETAMEMVRANNPDILIAPPFILNSLAASESLMEEVSSKVSMIGFAGSPLSKTTGNILTERFSLFSIYGASEMGIVHKIAHSGRPWDRGAWNSMMLHPKDNIQFRQIGSDANTFEAVLIRNPSAEDEQPVFKLFPQLQEWSTKDTFRPDPDRSGYWIYEARVDDILILNTGQTANPVGFEQRVSSNPLIAAAMMVGSGRPQTALVVQMLHPPTTTTVYDDLWAILEECNSQFPPQVKVERSHVIVALPERPLPRSAKGTIQRAAAQRLYRAEIESVYGTS